MLQLPRKTQAFDWQGFSSTCDLPSRGVNAKAAPYQVYRLAKVEPIRYCNLTMYFRRRQAYTGGMDRQEALISLSARPSFPIHSMTSTSSAHYASASLSR